MAPEPTIVTVRLNEPLQPLQRAERYEDPLASVYAARLPGCSVTGGGSLVGDDGEVVWCDLELEWTGDEDRALHVTTVVLEHLGVARGSWVDLPGRRVPLGATEGVALHLDGTGLPADVYATSDVNVVIEALEKALDDAGSLHGWWEGPRETALYFYGASAADVEQRLTAAAAAHPLCAGMRVVRLPLEVADPS